jgi:hypothetical protein
MPEIRRRSASSGLRGSVPDIREAAKQGAVEVGLAAAIVSVEDYEPRTLVIPGGVARAESESGARLPDADCLGLPSGSFAPLRHRTLEIGLRSWVNEQTGLDLGYVEQLYTFGDRGRHALPEDDRLHVVSIGYLALTRGQDGASGPRGASWSAWYRHFPWEDWRAGKPELLSREIEPRLEEWAGRPESPRTPARPLSRRDRLRIGFGGDGGWDEEKVLERYELLYEAGLVGEAARDGREAASAWGDLAGFGVQMRFDHRRILATAMGRLRGKLKYRPVIFELMPETFTLLELQRVVEAILGSFLHKQNFRRLVENGGLVEATGEVRDQTGGRPARVFRFRRSVLLERPAPGMRVRAQQMSKTVNIL